MLFEGSKVLHCNIATKESGESRGFGVVKFPDMESAEAAVLKMNGAELEGRTIACHVDSKLAQ